MSRSEDLSIVKIRVFATMMVVLLHVSAPVRDQWHSMADMNWFIGAIFDSLGRSGVPLFVMISGALLLPKLADWREFYRKRFTRILIPMLIWSILFAYFWEWQTAGGKSVIEILFSVLNGPTYYHLWYFYMLVGLYLIAPFIQVLIQHLSKQQLEFLLILWIVIRLLIPHLQFQLSTWLHFQLGFGFQFNFPDLYLGYFILGYYLRVYGLPFKIGSKGWLFFGVTVLQAALSASVYAKSGTYQEFMIMPYSPTVLIQASLFFCWMNETKEGTVPSWMRVLNACSFGIYLIHPLIIELMRIGYKGYSLGARSMDTVLSIPATWVITLIISVVSIYILMKIPYIRKSVS
jgi:surface polysaccharide O-acyltransferase-like enzyme